MQGADRSCKTKAQLRLKKGVGPPCDSSIRRPPVSPGMLRQVQDLEPAASSSITTACPGSSWSSSRAVREEDQEGEGLIPDPSGAVSRSNQLQDRGNKTVEVQY